MSVRGPRRVTLGALSLCRPCLFVNALVETAHCPSRTHARACSTTSRSPDTEHVHDRISKTAAHPARASTTASSAPRLNALSLRVREAFQGRAFQPEAASAARAAALDVVLNLIVADSTAESSIASASPCLSPSSSLALPSGRQGLHPLLCVRVMEELGYALWDQQPDGGWLRHVQLYPSLSVGSSSVTTARPDQQTLAHLCVNTTLPLLQHLTPHTPSASSRALPAPVRRVLPVMWEWLCTLPSSSTSFLQMWMPVLLSHMEAASSSSPRRDAAATATTMTAIPFEVLAPRLIRHIVSTSEQNRPQKHAIPDTTTSGPLDATLAEDWLMRILQLIQGSRRADKDAHCEDTALAHVLFWDGETPLLRHALVRTALAKVRTPAAVSTAALSSSSPSCTSLHASVRLAVPFADDDELRRLLLRVSSVSAELVASRHDVGSVTVLVEPVFTPRHDEHGDEGAVDDDLPLRFIRPMRDYVSLLTSSPTSSRSLQPPLQLSFAGLVGLLGLAIERLQTLRRQSSCQSAHDRRQPQREGPPPSRRTEADDTTAHLTLLPHKPRLHALKATCEILLHDARTQLRVAHHESSATAEAAVMESQRMPLFRDVPTTQQEAILRRLCGTARALVRVVMEEKRWSIAHEGAEGAALAAGGAAPHALSGVSAKSVAKEREALGQILRNAAHRVMEPALWRYYDATAYQAPAVQITLDDLDGLFASLLNANEPGGPRQGWRGRAGAEWYVEGLKDRYDTVYEAMRALDHVMGGRKVGRRTALSLLRTQAHLSDTVALESIRLLAVADLLVPASAASPLPPSPHTVDRARTESGVTDDETPTADSIMKEMRLVLNAFFPLWYKVVREESGAAPRLAQSLLLTVLLWMRQCCVRQAPQLCAQSHVLAYWRSLEGLLTSQGHASPWALVGLDTLLSAFDRPVAAPATEEAETATGSRPFACSLFFPSSAGVLCAFQGTGSGDLVTAANATLWELAEELALLAGTVESDLTDVSGSPSGPTTWRWLGSTAAVKEALRGLEDANRHGQRSATRTPTPHFFLLPWSTLATGRQPLRFYDESGQSASAVDLFDHDLQRLLAFCRRAETKEEVVMREGNGDDVDGGGSAFAVVRLVSLPEELTVFASASYSAESTIPGTRMRVVHPEVELEQTLLALRPTPSSLSGRMTNGSASADVGEHHVNPWGSDYDDTEEESDGLD